MATQKEDNISLLSILSATQKLLEDQQKRLAQLEARSNQPDRPELTIEALAPSIQTFVYDPDNGVTFDAWFSLHEDIFREDAKSLDDSARVRLLLRKLNPQGHEGYVNSLLPKAPRDFTFDETVARLKDLFGRRESLFHTRWRCLQIQKKETDDFQTHSTVINKICEEFKLGELTPEHFKCLVFILSLKSKNDSDVRTRLLHKLEVEKPETLTLSFMASEATRLTNLKTESADLELKDTMQGVHFVQRQGKPKKGNSSNSKSQQSGRNSQTQPTQQPKSPCWFCGGLHFVKQCNYSKHTCKDCSRVGHKEGYCSQNNSQKNSSSSKSQSKQKQIHSSKSNVNPVSVHHTVTNSQAKSYIDVVMNGKSVKLLFDTGSDVTIISKDVWRHLGSPVLSETPSTASDAQGNHIPMDGEFFCTVDFKGDIKRARCLVTNVNINLFGVEWINLFNLWEKTISSLCSVNSVSEKDIVTSLKTTFPSVFSSTMGKCTKGQAHLQLKPSTVPVFRPKRPVPYHVTDLVDEELQRLQNLDIISPVDHSEYAAPIVVARKPNGSIRICADYSTGLNNNLESHHYPIPTPDQIFATLSTCSVFSQIDLSDAYLQIEMDEESKKLLTINTHRGLFTFNRLCPGVKSAPGIFQQLIDTMLAGINGVHAYFDDVLIASKTKEEHHQTLLQVFRRLSEYDFRVKLEKCNFFQKEVRFLGFILDAKGQRPDPAKIDAIISMPAPSNIAQLRSFLGAVTFYSRFVKSLSTIRAPLDKMLQKDVGDWNWTPQYQKAFIKVKEILSSNLLLTHYNPSLPITIAADASETGIGCVAYHTMENGQLKAFYHASRTLTKAEKNYSQIDKEGLGLVYAVQKFHTYIYGRKFTLQTDHKPLLSIFGSKKGVPIHTANRLQRWALILLAYDFNIEYVPTNEFGGADVLSRLIEQQKSSNEDFIIAQVRDDEIVDNILISDVNKRLPVTFKKIETATLSSPTLQEVSNYIRHGWPRSTADFSPEVANYYKIRDSLTLIHSCIVYRDRIVIPPIFRNAILKQLHDAHPGINRMKSLARSYVFWPHMDSDIENLVKSCSSCAAAAKNPTKCDLSSWPLTSRPWQRVHADYAGPIDGQWFLVLVDAYTKWPEVYMTTTTTSLATISKISDACSRFGFMETIVTDNGTQFTSAEFAEFCRERGITHITTAPFHPQSNGLAERFVDTLKRSLSKLSGIGNTQTALTKFLMSYRCTPNPNTFNGSSPAELMMSRPLRTTLSLTQPMENDPIERNTAMENQYNKKHGTKSRSFVRGEEVLAKCFRGNHSFWAPGTIIEKRGNVMYNVSILLPRGCSRLIRSHVNQLRKRYPDTNESADDPSLVEGQQVSIPFDYDDGNQSADSSADGTSQESSNVPMRRSRQPYRNPRLPTRSSPPRLRSRLPRRIPLAPASSRGEVLGIDPTTDGVSHA
ncbi:uncharacterized protein K02A2.6-like [Phlebotomus papatasi]|uniref:uncharacterized protein K02A2.6-like n=1 Tax=Phlebotomus papatasi TaxID=29031 RepID=UPI0024842AD8|nr:uncharacterized protein K02A2.6-like [Phlebotomus papatasi]